MTFLTSHLGYVLPTVTTTTWKQAPAALLGLSVSAGHYEVYILTYFRQLDPTSILVLVSWGRKCMHILLICVYAVADTLQLWSQLPLTVIQLILTPITVVLSLQTHVPCSLAVVTEYHSFIPDIEKSSGFQLPSVLLTNAFFSRKRLSRLHLQAELIFKH